MSLLHLAAYHSGRVDSVLRRIADVQPSFSTPMVAIIVLAIVNNASGDESYSHYAMIILILVVIVITINLLGGFLRDVFNPRLQKSQSVIWADLSKT